MSTNEMTQNFKFTEGERVLCFHGPLIYEAKALKSTVSKDKQIKYYIHYAGWSKNWDEWVPENRVLKYNDANVQRQKEVFKQHSAATKNKKGSAKSKKSDAAATNAAAAATTASGESRAMTPSKDVSNSAALSTTPAAVATSTPITNSRSNRSTKNATRPITPVINKNETADNVNKKDDTTATATTPKDDANSSTNLSSSANTTVSAGAGGGAATAAAGTGAKDDKDETQSSSGTKKKRIGSHTSDKSGNTNTSTTSTPTPTGTTTVGGAAVSVAGATGTTASASASSSSNTSTATTATTTTTRTDNNCVESEETFLTKIEVKIKIPEELKQFLTDDWDGVTRQRKLLEIPAKVTVQEIVDQYLAFKKAAKSTNATKEVAISDVLEGIIEYFNVMLGSQLLYKFERPQYADILHKHPDTPPSQLYGSFHLLRLFTKLGAMMGYSALDEKSMQNLLVHIHDFLKFLVKNSTTYFSMSNFVNADTAHYRQAQ